MTHAERCAIAQQCVPPSAFRAQLTALHDEMLAAVASERERCMGAMDSHGRYWVENRSRIIDAVSAAGFRIMSTRDRFWLEPVGPNV